MNTSRTLLYTLIIPAFLLQAQSLHMFAQWSHDPTVNTPICTAVNSQNAPAIVSDGTGGAIITWNDQRFSSYGNNYVYAQRVDASGAARWVLNGVSICNAGRPPITPIPPAIVTDDSGGAIIVWHDFRFQWTIYAQRISSAGVTQWQSDGVAVSFSMGASPAVQFRPIVAADGKGGAIVCWQAFRNGSSAIYAQRVNRSGVVQWGTNCVAASSTTNTWVVLAVVGDDKGGAIITWSDSLGGTGYNTHAQRISSGGVVQWGPNGLAVTTGANSHWGGNIICDGSGGAIITWEEPNVGNLTDLMAQRLDSTGTARWGQNGIAISTTAGSYSIANSAAGNLVVAWADGRSGTSLDMYAQRINAAGAAAWDSGGVTLCTAPNRGGYPAILIDGMSDPIIAWRRADAGILYAQRINTSGAVQWPLNGVVLSTSAPTGSPAGDITPAIASDRAGGAIVTWPNWYGDIYAQQVGADGVLGELANSIKAEVHPREMQLFQNYPNPFNPSTTIQYALPQRSYVTLDFFNTLGQLVTTLVNGEEQAGYHEVKFDGSNLASGVYFYRLQAGSFVQTRKLLLLR